MMKALPHKIDPMRCAHQQLRLDGSVQGKMPRLETSLTAPLQEGVEIHWRFYQDEAQRARVEGSVAVRLSLLCQRCLQPLYWQVHANTRLCFLKPGQQDDFPSEIEVVVVESPLISLVELIEDELILALPLAPMHEQCPES